MQMKQGGMALIVALVISLVIGIVAVAIGESAMRSQRMATIERDQLSSLLNAQSTISWVEGQFAQLVTNDQSKIFVGTSGAISSQLDSNPDWWRDDNNWTEDNGVHTISAANVASQPMYRMEQRQFVPFSVDLSETNGMQFYRVTVRDTTSGQTTTKLQALFMVVVPKPTN